MSSTCSSSCGQHSTTRGVVSQLLPQLNPAAQDPAQHRHGAAKRRAELEARRRAPAGRAVGEQAPREEGGALGGREPLGEEALHFLRRHRAQLSLDHAQRADNHLEEIVEIVRRRGRHLAERGKALQVAVQHVPLPPLRGAEHG
ncbi:hypothetical protein [Roseomonas chloroacetimidivorans]|uniref:hypothetical protein n=1 Tax=Roseomonas chloroacetimidivorans TaxID=1766656 RepID=UPI003C75A560